MLISDCLRVLSSLLHQLEDSKLESLFLVLSKFLWQDYHAQKG